MLPKSDRPTSAITVTEALNARARKKERGSIGAGVNASQATNASSSSPAPPSHSTVVCDVQLWGFVLITPWVRAQTRAATSRAPTGSSEREPGSRDSDTAIQATEQASAPIGTLIQKTAAQP